MDKYFYVYIMASQKNGTLYIGMTSDLKGRVYDHKEGRIAGFTKRYNIKRLVYYEPCDTADDAIEREAFLKKQTRAYKIKLIEAENADWGELYHDLRYLP